MDEEFAEDVRAYGWSMASISDHTPPFQYTIGLMETLHHPELIIFGLNSDNGHALFSGLVRDIRTGRSFAEPGVHTVNLGSDEHRVGFRRVHPTQHPLYLGFAMGFLTNISRIGDWRRCRFSGQTTLVSFRLMWVAIWLYISFSRGLTFG